MSCVLEVRGRADHGPVYSPARALRLRGRLVAAREPLQPDLASGARHVNYSLKVHHAPVTTLTYTHRVNALLLLLDVGIFF